MLFRFLKITFFFLLPCKFVHTFEVPNAPINLCLYSPDFSRIASFISNPCFGFVHINTRLKIFSERERGKSRVIKFDDVDGRGTSPKREIWRPGNIWRRKFIDAVAV